MVKVVDVVVMVHLAAKVVACKQIGTVEDLGIVDYWYVCSRVMLLMMRLNDL